MIVMAGHSRSKNGVASLAYVPAIHALLPEKPEWKTWMPATGAGMTARRSALTGQHEFHRKQYRQHDNGWLGLLRLAGNQLGQHVGNKAEANPGCD